MSYSLVTAASSYPVTVAACKHHSRIDGSDDDTYLDGLIAAAVELFQQKTNRQLINATYKLTLDQFPGDAIMRLAHAPIDSITSIKYYDGDNVQQAWSDSNYLLDSSTEPGRVYIAADATTPTTYERPDAVEITYLAGYGSAATDVPQTIRHGIKLLVAHWYENREAVSFTQGRQLPLAMNAIVNLYTVGRLP